jgi:hypothetical protein
MAIGELNVGQDLELIANGTVAIYTVVSLSTADSNGNARVVTCPDSVTRPLGVAQNAAADGESVQVRLAGISLISANGAYALADELMVAASDGEVDTFSTSATVNAYVVGQALEAAGAAQDRMAVLIGIYAREANT